MKAWSLDGQDRLINGIAHRELLREQCPVLGDSSEKTTGGRVDFQALHTTRKTTGLTAVRTHQVYHLLAVVVSDHHVEWSMEEEVR